MSYTFTEPVLRYSELSLINPPLVRTLDMQRHFDLVKPWLDAGEPLLMVGPEGCGKSLLLQV